MRSADTVWIGPKQMTVESGQQWLEWQPGKKGSAFVSMPMMPQLIEAIEAVKLTTSEVFLLNAHGRPYKTVATLQERIRRWTKDADLTGRSQHGLRKAMAELLAEAGCSDHQIMAIMAHTQPTTSAIYTAKARRKIMAEVALEKTGRLAFE